MMRRAILVSIGCVLLPFLYLGGRQGFGPDGLRSFQSSSQMWPTCLKNDGSGPLRAMIDQQEYRVPASDIYMMSECVEGQIKWITVRNVTKYKVLLTIESRDQKFKINFERARTFARTHTSDQLTSEGLLHDPTFDDEQRTNFLGLTDAGTLLTLACTDKNARPQQHYCNVMRDADGGPILEYYFDLSDLPRWKAVDDAVQSYIAQIKQPNVSSR